MRGKVGNSFVEVFIGFSIFSLFHVSARILFRTVPHCSALFRTVPPPSPTGCRRRFGFRSGLDSGMKRNLARLLSLSFSSSPLCPPPSSARSMSYPDVRLFTLISRFLKLIRFISAFAATQAPFQYDYGGRSESDVR